MPEPVASHRDRWASSGLTLLGLVLVAASVWGAMRFLVWHLCVPAAYWLVPIFGALGGVVGGILRSDNKLELCSFEQASRIKLGVVGDVVVGLGGASALTFLFGGTNLLNFDVKNLQSLVLLVSASCVGGAYGRKIMEIAGEKLLRQAREESRQVAKEESRQVVKEESRQVAEESRQVAKEEARQVAEESRQVAKEEARQVAKEESRSLVNPTKAIAYTLTATNLINAGRDFETALDILEKALDSDPKNAGAWVERGRALKKLGRIQEALEAVEQALKIDPKKVEALYNRACYNALLGGDIDSIVEDLKKSLELAPALRKIAKTDPDLEKVRNNKKIMDLLEGAT